MIILNKDKNSLITLTPRQIRATAHHKPASTRARTRSRKKRKKGEGAALCYPRYLDPSSEKNKEAELSPIRSYSGEKKIGRIAPLYMLAIYYLLFFSLGESSPGLRHRGYFFWIRPEISRTCMEEDEGFVAIHDYKYICRGRFAFKLIEYSFEIFLYIYTSDKRWFLFKKNNPLFFLHFSPELFNVRALRLKVLFALDRTADLDSWRAYIYTYLFRSIEIRRARPFTARKSLFSPSRSMYQPR